MYLSIRKSPRRSEYDYHSEGCYFVTIVTKNREQYFGEIRRDALLGRPQMVLNRLGKYCEQEIIRISQRKSVDIHEYVVMPNHVHIIIGISNYPVGADHKSARNTDQSARNDDQIACKFVGNNFDDKLQSDDLKITNNLINPVDLTNPGDLKNRPYEGPILSSIVKLFKGNVTKYANAHNIPFARQSRYHDHIIRNSIEYDRIAYYIQTNPENREKDSLQ